MRQSHLTTPRTSQQAQWDASMDPIERPAPRMHWQDRLTVWASIVALVALCIIGALT